MANKNTHGGRREGAGRKATWTDEKDKPKRRSLEFSDNEWERLKAAAEKGGQTIKAFILSRCLP